MKFAFLFIRIVIIIWIYQIYYVADDKKWEGRRPYLSITSNTLEKTYAYGNVHGWR